MSIELRNQIFWHTGHVSRVERAKRLGQSPRCIWLTGLSGAGKSSLAAELELALTNTGKHAYVLDGDNIRHGLNKDLGFSVNDRRENIRRVAEVSRLMVDAGLIVIVAFISPFRAERDEARTLFRDSEFIEVFVDSSLETCEWRDTKGLYAKARQGFIKDFTGIDSPYEPPINPELHLKTDLESVTDSVQHLLEFLRQES